MLYYQKHTLTHDKLWKTLYFVLPARGFLKKTISQLPNPLSQTFWKWIYPCWQVYSVTGKKRWKVVNGFTYIWSNWVHLFISFARIMHFSPHFFDVTCCNVCQRLRHVPRVSCCCGNCWLLFLTDWVSRRAVQCWTLLLRVRPTPRVISNLVCWR